MKIPELRISSQFAMRPVCELIGDLMTINNVTENDLNVFTLSSKVLFNFNSNELQKWSNKFWKLFALLSYFDFVLLLSSTLDITLLYTVL